MGWSAEDIEAAGKHSWFHAIELPGLTTRGRFRADRPQNVTLFSVMDFLKDIDVRGMDCLDIGTTDGLIAFGLEKRGAKSVVATDRVAGPGFALVHKALHSRVERIAPSEISTIQEDLSGRSFDLIVCAGVIYHMLNPMSAIMACRSLLKPGGLLIIETAIHTKSDEPVMLFNADAQLNMESSTYWMPTPKALAGMVRLCHFETLGGRWMTDNARGAVLGRAVEGVSPGASTLMTAMQDLPLLDYPFRESLARANKLPASSIAFSGAVEDRVIGERTYRPDFPYHAHRIDEQTAVGKPDWSVVAAAS